MGFPGGMAIKHPPAKQEMQVRSPGRKDSPGEGNGNPHQCSCLKNPMDRGSWQVTVPGIAKELDTIS